MAANPEGVDAVRWALSAGLLRVKELLDAEERTGVLISSPVCEVRRGVLVMREAECCNASSLCFQTGLQSQRQLEFSQMGFYCLLHALGGLVNCLRQLEPRHQLQWLLQPLPLGELLLLHVASAIEAQSCHHHL